MQSLYEHFITENHNINTGEKNLINSIESLKTLSCFQLAILPNLVRIAEDRIEDSRKKMLPTKADLEPNLKFINNLVINKIAENLQFQKIVKDNTINYGNDLEIIRQMFNRILDWHKYQKYLHNNINDFEEDRDFIISLYDEIYFQSEAITSYVEERNIHWGNDFYDASVLTIKLLRQINVESDNYSLLPFFDINDDEYNDDISFVKTLYRQTIKNSDELEKAITVKLQNWDTERVAFIDLIILKMAITEFTECPSVPIKVTINEYIELSKEFSTPKSKIFINGILDKLVNDLKDEGKIKKIGRGLIG